MLSPRDNPPTGFIIVTIMTPTLLHLKTELRDDVVLYSPQRVMSRFGYNQEAMMISGNFVTSKAPVAVARFISEGKNQILASLDKLFQLAEVRVTQGR